MFHFVSFSTFLIVQKEYSSTCGEWVQYYEAASAWSPFNNCIFIVFKYLNHSYSQQDILGGMSDFLKGLIERTKLITVNLYGRQWRMIKIYLINTTFTSAHSQSSWRHQKQINEHFDNVRTIPINVNLEDIIEL